MPELLGVPETGKAGKNPRKQSARKESAAAAVLAASEEWHDGVVSSLGRGTGKDAIQTSLLHLLVHVEVLPLVATP